MMFIFINDSDIEPSMSLLGNAGICLPTVYSAMLIKNSSRKHSVPSCPCLLVPCCALSCLLVSCCVFSCLAVSSRVLLCLLVSSRATVLQDFVQILESFSSKCEIF